MRATADVPSAVVDVYNCTTGAWSTAQLSVGRYLLAAASVGNVALFAGGYINSALLCREGGVRSHLLLRFARSAVLWLCLPLMCATAGVYVTRVDVYNGATGAWSTAQLSVARYYLAAASVGNVALFAGGVGVSALLCRDWGVRLHLLLRACFVSCA